jgi:hypothetical protein
LLLLLALLIPAIDRLIPGTGDGRATGQGAAIAIAVCAAIADVGNVRASDRTAAAVASAIRAGIRSLSERSSCGKRQNCRRKDLFHIDSFIEKAPMNWGFSRD